MAINFNYKDINVEKVNTFTVCNDIECKVSDIPQENVEILSITPSVTLKGFTSSGKDYLYSGKAIFTVVYSENNLIKSGVYGVEFEYKCLSGVENAEVFGKIYVKDVKIENANGISMLNAKVYLNGSYIQKTLNKVVENVEDCKCLPKNCEYSTYLGSFINDFTVEDEFPLSYSIVEVICHTEKVNVLNANCIYNSLSFDGELEVCLLLKNSLNELFEETKIIPFRCEAPSELILENSTAIVSARCKDCKIKIKSDETKNKSEVKVEGLLESLVKVYGNGAIETPIDVYKQDKEVEIEYQTLKLYKINEVKRFTEKCSGELPLKIDKNSRLIFTSSVKIEEDQNVIKNGKLNIYGGVLVDAIFSLDGGFVKQEVLCPYNVQIVINGNAYKNLNLNVSDFSLRVVGGVLFYDFNLKGSFLDVNEKEVKFIKNVVEGKNKEINTSAISVFIPEENDNMFTVMKALGVNEEEVLSCNENVCFPLSKTDRVVIYREEK